MSKREYHPIVSLIKNNKPLFLIEILLQGDTDPDFYQGYWHSIKWAWGNLGACELLMKYGANVDIGHASHGPELSYLATAVDEENLEMVKLLLKYGASPYISTVRGEYGNVLTFSKKNDEIRKLVLERMKEYNSCENDVSIFTSNQANNQKLISQPI
jgi:ankyrin repeat protein